MPTITFSLKDLENLVGRKIPLEKLKELLEYAKGELEKGEEGEVTVELNDTNQPYLWSVEGLARLLKGVLGVEKGIPKIKVEKSGNKLLVEKGVRKVRPYIGALVAKGKKIDNYFLKQIIQLQEKLCENFGRRREKVAIGVYPLKRIKFPIHYKAVRPESVKFVPLDFRKEMTLGEILEEHPKGKDYAWILKGKKGYPLLVDDGGRVLSFPPIINSEETGRLEAGDTELFFEATGTDFKAVSLAANIFAYALHERGFKIESVTIIDGQKKIITPVLEKEKIRIKKEQIKQLLGLELNEQEIKNLLEKARFGFDNYLIEIPSYRQDILHAFDVVEDIGIMHGYGRIKELPLTSYTVGGTFPKISLINKLRDLAAGLGYQEVFSPVLSSKEVLFGKMNFKEKLVEIKNFMSETYSCVRSWLLPILLEVLSKNKHQDYPQKIFEQGLVTVRKGGQVEDKETLALVSCHEKADFTEAKQILDSLLRGLGLECSVKEGEHSSFIPGRAGDILIRGKKAGIVGEISPAVLSNWGLTLPAAGFELDLEIIFEFLR